MKITTQKELDDLIATADISNNIVLDEDLLITFDCEIRCNLKAENIYARNLYAHNINAHNLYARNLYAFDIIAHNLYALNIDAHNIYAHNIDIARNEDEKVTIELTKAQLDKIKHLIN